MMRRTDSKRSASEADAKIGARVRAARLERGVSQQELAARLGVTFQQVQKYEAGTNRIAAARLVEIAKHLAKPVGWFLSDLPESRIGAAAPELDPNAWRALATPEGAALIAQFARIESPDLRRSVLAIVTGLAEGAAPPSMRGPRAYRRRGFIGRS